MTERKWTSGPWVVEAETLYGTDFGYTVPLIDFGFYAENERHEHDARLIAAAPDLYEALEWAMNEINGATSYDNDAQYQNCISDAENALAKAKGSTA